MGIVLRTFVEGKLHHRCRGTRSSNIDFDAIANVGGIGANIRHRNRLIERGGKGAAGYRTDRLTVGSIARGLLSGRTATFHFQSDAFRSWRVSPGRSGGFAGQELAPYKASVL